MITSLLKWIFGHRRSLSVWTVSYGRGDPSEWVTGLSIKQAERHIPKLYEKHGNRRVIGIQWRPL